MALPQNPIQNDTDDASRLLLKKKGVKYASDKELESRSDAYEEFEKAASGLVVFGVIFEFFVAYLHPAYDSPRGVLGPLLGDAYVAIGLAIEVFCGTRVKAIQSELTRRSKDKLKEALERATRADEQLAPRSITQEQQRAISAKLKPFGKHHAYIAVSPDLPESQLFARVIGAAIGGAGWEVTLPALAEHMSLYPGGISVSFTDQPKSRDAALLVCEALVEAGIVAVPRPGQNRIGNPDPTFIVLTVGMKPSADAGDETMKWLKTMIANKWSGMLPLTF